MGHTGSGQNRGGSWPILGAGVHFGFRRVSKGSGKMTSEWPQNDVRMPDTDDLRMTAKVPWCALDVLLMSPDVSLTCPWHALTCPWHALDMPLTCPDMSLTCPWHALDMPWGVLDVHLTRPSHALDVPDYNDYIMAIYWLYNDWNDYNDYIMSISWLYHDYIMTI